MDCVVGDRSAVGLTGDLIIPVLDRGAWYKTVFERGCRNMVAWARK